jgi:hypothetical protein
LGPPPLAAGRSGRRLPRPGGRVAASRGWELGPPPLAVGRSGHCLPRTAARAVSGARPHGRREGTLCGSRKWGGRGRPLGEGRGTVALV